MGACGPASLSVVPKDYTTAFRAYFDACPHTDNQGICNGVGKCNVNTTTGTGACTCPEETYLQRDGNCYPLCPDDCNKAKNQGMCINGTCSCTTFHHDNVVAFAFTGVSCAEGCGTSIINVAPDILVVDDPYDSGSQKALDEYYIDPNQDPGDSAAQQWACGEILLPNPTRHPAVVSMFKVQGGSVARQDASNFDTYAADGGNGQLRKVCSISSWDPFSTCGCISAVTCQFGTIPNCPTEQLAHPGERGIRMLSRGLPTNRTRNSA